MYRSHDQFRHHGTSFRKHMKFTSEYVYQLSAISLQLLRPILENYRLKVGFAKYVVLFWKVTPVLSLRQFEFLVPKLDIILCSSENDSNISPLLAISCQFVSTFGIKISQNWKSHPYVKSMGNYIFRVKTGKWFVQIWKENIFPISDMKLFRIWLWFLKLLPSFGEFLRRKWKRHSCVKSMGIRISWVKTGKSFVQFRKRIKHFSTFGNKLSVCVHFWNKN